MAALPPSLLAVAFDVVFDKNRRGEEAVRWIEERVPRYTFGQRAEAYRQVMRLMDETWRIAEDYFRTGGNPSEDWQDLRQLCPGFADGEYWTAWNRCLVWASK